MSPTDETLLRELQAAKAELAEELLEDPNVVGVGVGFAVRDGKLTRELALRIYVRTKFAEELLPQAELLSPERFGGLPIDVIESTYRPGCAVRRSTGSRALRRRPGSRTMWRPSLVGGISIGNPRLRLAGTLGSVFLTRGDGQPMLLTNWHVLLAGVGASGDPVWQPAPGYDAGGEDPFVALVERGVIDARMDAAVARLEGERRSVTDRVLGIGAIEGTAPPELGMEVWKSGAGSGRTRGMVDDASFTYLVQYPGFQQRFEDQVHVVSTTRGPMSCSGDSGALLVESTTKRAVGMLYAEEAGGSHLDFAVASPVRPILEEFGLTLRE